MFRYFTYHLRGERRIIRSKTSAFYNVVVLCYIGYVVEHKLLKFFMFLQCFFTMIEITFCARYSVCCLALQPIMVVFSQPSSRL